MKFATKAIHAGVEPDPTTGAIMTPIYQTSTYVQESPGKHKGYEYSRTHNPTRTALQNALAALGKREAWYLLRFGPGRDRRHFKVISSRRRDHLDQRFVRRYLPDHAESV